MQPSIGTKPFFTLCIVMGSLAVDAQTQPSDGLVQKYAVESFRDLYALLSLPNDAHYPEGIEKNIQWCESAFAKRGFATLRLETPTVPLLLAERKAKGALKTVLIYLQIDGQPVDSSKWFQESPWTPTLKEKDKNGEWNAINYDRLYDGYNPDWRVFARSTSDAKGPAVAFLAALDAMAGAKATPNFNIKVIMDFEEELGSPRLPAAVDRYKKELASDMLVIFDGPRHVSNQPTLSFGARGICEITLTTYGPRQPVHSGNYGNYTPNPAMRLSQLLASMKDEEGRVIIPGYYEGIALSDAEKETLALVPDNEKEINKFLGIAEADKVGGNFQESLQYPTLNIRGLNALYVGDKARTLIPAQATAGIDIRLVPASDPERLIGLVRKHIESKGYYLTKGEPTEEERMKYPRIASFNSSISYLAFQTPFDSEAGRWLSRAMAKAFGKEPIKIRTAGGSIPISPFVVTLGVPAVAVPTVNADNNQHAPNENIRVGNYVDAVKTFYYILMEKP
ncbi:MAG: M20/M25/M40 family metallo-hydrolase [Cyclobacteriaceae bacterium]|nr:M20/M25/M40 family metallo-hydrolase [Cyclobacteriaceae bacterium]MCB0499666.1 M20/M25/M40 family metallo-hydrolase [Cyclobacteriaceae bacterium]MCB9239409.1 M20/M25/M40 family metallo-hydrolase [Flammeovirgaceae bacterium]MCO5271208.1 M20/M25/M40 family metallo-hydrolase [Cyclobacteriaceae bacterium]MCW5902586.1 M20/M25/M40 family metallo-hydrolase [Cyclobacteriaceae bacterium]